jgi:hypothetical protein
MRTDEIIKVMAEMNRLADILSTARWYRKLPNDENLRAEFFGALNQLEGECAFYRQKLENEKIAAEEAAIPS